MKLNNFTNILYLPLINYNEWGIFIYVLLAIGIIYPAIKMLTANSHISAVLYFLFSVVNQAGLLAFLGYEFFSLVLLLVYIGAVIILYVFIVMLTAAIPMAHLLQKFYFRKILVLGFLLFAELVCVLQRSYYYFDSSRFNLMDSFDNITHDVINGVVWFFNDGLSVGYLLFTLSTPLVILLSFFILVALIGSLSSASFTDDL